MKKEKAAKKEKASKSSKGKKIPVKAFFGKITSLGKKVIGLFKKIRLPLPQKGKVKKEKPEKEYKETKGNRRKFPLFLVLMIFSALPLVIVIAIVCTTSLNLSRKNLERATKDTLYIASQNLANHCNQNKISYATADTYNDYIDGLQNQHVEMAIILNDAPCVASIKNDNGYRIREIEIDESRIETGYYEKNIVIEGKSYYGYFMPITVNDKIVGMAFAGQLREYLSKTIMDFEKNFLILAVIMVVLFILFTILFSKQLTKTFKIINKRMEVLANGSLLKQREHRNSIVEMNQLLLATKSLQGNLAETIGKVKTVSEKLVINISEVTGLSENNAKGAENILSAMQELSESASGIAVNVQDINTQMSEIGNCINDISNNVSHLNQSSDHILQTNADAKANMTEIMNSSVRSVEAVDFIMAQIKETNQSISEIDTAVELILSISEQTKLLSLNASIEAAHAGEMGKGFAVVAEEIRNLSDQSSRGAAMIKDIAKQIVEKSQKSVILADEVHVLILAEQDGVGKTQSKYEELSDDIDKSVHEIHSIAQMTDTLTEYKEKVISNVQNLTAISEQNAAGNQEINANINKIILDVQNVNRNCERMNEMSADLESSVSYFNDQA